MLTASRVEDETRLATGRKFCKAFEKSASGLVNEQCRSTVGSELDKIQNALFLEGT